MEVRNGMHLEAQGAAVSRCPEAYTRVQSVWLPGWLPDGDP